MSWTTFGKDRGMNIYSNCEIHIVKLLSTPLTESYPSEMWLLFMTKTSRIGKVEALVTGSDGHVRGAVVQVKTKAGRLTKLRRPVQRLYPLEVRCRNDEPETTISSRRAEPDPVNSVRPEQNPELRRGRPRRVAAVEADRRKRTWLENLN